MPRMDRFLAMRRTLNARLGIRWRLGIGFGLVLACLAVITGLSYFTLERTTRLTQDSAEAQASIAAVASEMSRRVNEARIALLGAAVATDADDGAAQRTAAIAAFKAYDAAAAQLDRDLARHPSFKALIEPARVVKATAADVRATLQSMMDRIGDPAERETVGAWLSYSERPALDLWTVHLNEFEAARQKSSVIEARAVDADARTARLALVVFAACAMLIGVGAAWLISRSVLRPVLGAVVMSRRIAHGDLSHAIAGDEGGEIGALIDALGQMQDGLRGLVRGVQRSTDGMALASGEVASGNLDLSTRTEQTAAELQRTAHSIQQLSRTVTDTANAVQTANQLVASTSQAAQRGRDAISQVVASMGTISTASGKIGEITGVIDSIAFQTNILALNAAVEAARAGEQGRGFAVVASEVRALAQRSSEAARQISTLIAANVETVSTGEAQVAGAEREMQAIFSGVQRVSEVIGGIRDQASNQSGELAQVAAAISRLDGMTQQNAALVEQGAASAESLRDEAGRLKQAVGSFRLEETQGSSS